mmetsp:Transcript_34317/g.75072  ORF Transcript_34317/g.75072 Transcript_34317/m.75072 type:complete len:395 (-) Transcript_34317:207-1391(-)|eukprot:CAMPEP_0118936966 /NCGR_PEP_ID=MMETSP1169-20130426/21224_1 /TAXON_ID=36882 /ORGANISM="Pyramimonas obovata, Strain CCMP722" /LENGTH=394 /DNA_ID=CAMNT_0006880443 /DNA_START=70 /DNA_END=1254 /DNA_ORIENTATION=-
MKMGSNSGALVHLSVMLLAAAGLKSALGLVTPENLGSTARDPLEQPNAVVPSNVDKTSSLAFVVYFTLAPTRSEGPKLPRWAQYNQNRKKSENMIKMNFESARMTHPECRLVILTDKHTPFTLTTLTPKLPGPPIELVRHKGLNTTEEMLSRLQARVSFLDKERGTHDLVFLDTDMLVVKNMEHVFDKVFDLAATWRQEPRMPVNGGIIFVPKDKLRQGRGFFQFMVDLTQNFIGKTAEEGAKRRWYGQCDQAALATIMSPRHGYQGPTPGTPEARQLATSEVRITYYPQPATEAAAMRSTRPANGPGHLSYDILLMGCTLYNGSIKKEPAPWCEKKQCCCSNESHIVHFKGDGKMYMETYWKEACANPATFQCAVIDDKCKRRTYSKKGRLRL